MSWNQQIGKKLNKEVILQQVLVNQYISRNEIIKNTELKKATVANLVNELIEENLVIEAGKEISTGGRRPSLLKLNKHAGYALGIDIGVNYLRGVIVDLRGEIVYENLQKIKRTTFESYFEKILLLIENLKEHVPPSPYHIIGIGIAVPGIIDNNGILLYAPNLKWENIDIISMLAQHVSYPLYLSNEANAGAYAEFSFTQNKQYQHLLYASIGIGIGVGIVVNGQIYKGENGYSGESGHMLININGKRCTCGKNGCWEAYASEYALIKEAEFSLRQRNISIEKLIELANEQPIVKELFAEIGFYIGIGIVNLIHTFNPGKIIIGNRIAIAQHFIEEEIYQTIRKHTNSYHLENVQIEFSTLRDTAIAIGAASFVVNQFLQPSSYSK